MVGSLHVRGELRVVKYGAMMHTHIYQPKSKPEHAYMMILIIVHINRCELVVRPVTVR